VKTATGRRDLYGGRSPREIPIYSSAEAAHYLRIPENTIRSWIKGRAYPTSLGHRRTAPVIPPVDPEGGLSFVNLLELHVLGAIRRQHHVDMKQVRAAVEFLKDHFHSDHPLADEEMDTDGTHLFVRKYGALINASKQGQGAMEAVLDAHLKRIERDPRGLAVRLFPFTRKGTDAPRIVSIDPLVAFGRPVIIGSRIPTSDVADRFKAGESPVDLAYDYGRPQAEIEEAIRYEFGTAAWHREHRGARDYPQLARLKPNERSAYVQLRGCMPAEVGESDEEFDAAVAALR